MVKKKQLLLEKLPIDCFGGYVYVYVDHVGRFGKGSACLLLLKVTAS